MNSVIKLWEERLQKTFLALARLTLGYVFFTQLFWKLPPTFGCPADFAFTTGTVESGRAKLERTSGLCDWIGIESVWARAPHPVLVADMRSAGGPNFSVDIGLLAAGNGAFIDSFVKPNIAWFGNVVWGMEAFIAVSMMLGLFSRAGALVGFAQAMQLWVGLAGISNPFEWEWSYNWMPVLALLLFAYAPGRIFGLDGLIRPRLLAAAEKGNTLARLLSLLM